MNHSKYIPELSLSNGIFIKCLKNYKHNSYLRKLRKLDNNIDFNIDGLFCYAQTQYMPDIISGWKIHISSTVPSSNEVIKIVGEYCFSKQIGFKFIRDQRILELINSKIWDRSSSGKFITIYPENLSIFKKTIVDLNYLLKGFNGPYILSDKRYKDSKVIFYRYGNINGKGELLPTGYKRYYLNQLNNEVQLYDEVQPYYFQPTHVSDPLLEQSTYNKEKIGLNDRYIVKKAISITNSGGVYLAKDTKKNQKVILKEARPYIGKYPNYSMNLRRYEVDILRTLNRKCYVPFLEDEFFEWEHYFIVVEYIDGILLSDYISELNTSIHSSKNINSVYKNHQHIFIQLLRILKDLHINQISYGDFSLNNIMLDQNMNVILLDFELASSNSNKNETFINHYTPGYRKKNRNNVTYNDRFILDKEALGLLMLQFYTKAGNYKLLDEKVLDEIFNKLVTDYNIPCTFKLVIQELLRNSNKTNVDQLITTLKKTELSTNKSVKFEFYGSLSSLEQEVEKCLELSVKTIINHANKNFIKGTIFPVYPVLNSKGLYTGDLGVLLTLKYINIYPMQTEKLIEEYFQQFDSGSIEHQTLGLFNGVGGYVFGFYLLGKQELALKIYNYIKNNYMKFKQEINIKNGISGYGLLSVFLYTKTKDEQYRLEAERVAEDLLHQIASYDRLKNNYKDKEIEFGLTEGLSGISLFLIHLYKITLCKKYLRVAKDIIYFILGKGVRYNNHIYIYKNSELNYLSPYIEGAAGVGKVLSSLVSLQNNEYDKIKLKQIMNGSSIKYSKCPTFTNGLSSIGSSLIDAYLNTGDSEYLKNLRHITEGILNYKVTNIEGDLFFPSEFNNHITFDFETGMSGILFYLKRFLKLLQRKPFI